VEAAATTRGDASRSGGASPLRRTRQEGGTLHGHVGATSTAWTRLHYYQYDYMWIDLPTQRRCTGGSRRQRRPSPHLALRGLPQVADGGKTLTDIKDRHSSTARRSRTAS
jgi:hypothetical protein